MTKKKALTPAQRAVKKERKKLFMHVLVNEKQVRVKRPATVDGMGVDEFIQRNADPIWLHQNEMYECIDEDEVHTEP
jgi:predicted metal-dependent hydrolase